MEKDNTSPPVNPVEVPLQPRQNPSNLTHRNFLVVILVLVLLFIVVGGAYYLGTQNKKQLNQPQAINNTPIPIQESANKESPTPIEAKSGATVRIVNGDIVVTQNGKVTKITSWGYNSEPILSPDGTKVAYISKSKESVENEKVDKGFKRTSTNIWVVNSDGSNPVQITNHINFVYRSHPYWLDNNKVLFVDGSQSVKVYNMATKTTQTVMGQEEAAVACLDACGFEIQFFYSPNHSYLIRLSGGGGGLGGNPPNSAVLNTQTLQSTEVKEVFGVNFETVSFPNNTTLTFEGSEVSNYEKQITVTINLSTAQVTKR